MSIVSSFSPSFFCLIELPFLKTPWDSILIGWGTHMLAGALAGISEHTVIYPVDAIKVGAPSRIFRVWLDARRLYFDALRIVVYFCRIDSNASPPFPFTISSSCTDYKCSWISCQRCLEPIKRSLSIFFPLFSPPSCLDYAISADTLARCR